MNNIITPEILYPALDIIEARPFFDDAGLSSTKYNFSLESGECALIECRDAVQRAQFIDICTGMAPIGEGTVRCLGLEWKNLEEKQIWALRGRIGRIFSNDSWIDMYGMHMNIVWSRLHHTRTPLETLVNEAVKLGIKFGLPGLPTQSPGRLTPLDRRRAEYVRAFLGSPSLLLLEDPVSDYPPELHEAFLSELTAAMQRGCAVIWIASSHTAWRHFAQDNMQMFRLGDSGLIEMRNM